MLQFSNNELQNKRDKKMKITVLLILIFNLIYANATLEIKKGWQLVGVDSSLNIKEKFNNENIDIVWAFDALTQSWAGYSPDENLSNKIDENYASIDKIEPYQALWVFSKNDWVLSYEQENSLDTPKNNKIRLESGWNLISMPQDIIVSDDFFADALVWSYSKDQEWSVNDDSLNFPSIDAIKLNDGLWVKSDTSKDIYINQESSKLSTFNSRDDMLSYIDKMLRMHNYYGYMRDDFMVLAESNDGSAPKSSVDNATSTNLQEEGVDEGDILKHDGVNIFSIDNIGKKIMITSFENISKQIYTPITNIDFSDKYIVSIYLQNSRLSVISTNLSEYQFIENDFDSKPMVQSESISLDIFDVSDINNINLLSTYNIDGYYKDSRVVDGELYLISQFTPKYEYEYPKEYVQTICSTLDENEAYATCDMDYLDDGMIDENEQGLQNCTYGRDYDKWNDNRCYSYNYDEFGAWKYDYENPIVISKNIIPMIKQDNNNPNELITHDRFYAPVKLNQRADITSLSAFTIDSARYNKTTSFIGNVHQYYASQDSFYLVSNEYPLYFDSSRYKEQQMIYKFALNSELSYIARGSVEGKMLNQFSMSEKDGYLRVATTSGWGWWGDGLTSNSVYVLKVEDSKLNVEGNLTGLGHEGERIYAVRFMGDRGFVVTFKQTDPLYTLDLSDPKNPKTVGELSIPGFSTYLHVVDENRLLSIGRNADENGSRLELQFQLFDISDFSNPILADKIQVGDLYSYSEAEYNHKAFTYRSSDMMFGIPYIDYPQVNSSSSENFNIYQIDGLNIVPIDNISIENSNWGNTGRGLIFDLNETTYSAYLKGSNIMSKNIQ